MTTASEIITSFPLEDKVHEVQRNEELLLQIPALRGPVMLRNHEPIKSVHFASTFKPIKFARPYGVYESNYLRVEWQTMDSVRQPFYHRNADVDEISYQVCGVRTLITEHGAVDLNPGDFVRIPVGVAHDNYGIDDIHLLFYIPAPVTESFEAVRLAEPRNEFFKGWTANQIPELTTLCLGGPECDIAASFIDENHIAEHMKKTSKENLLKVLRPEEKSLTTTWVYKSRFVWLAANDQRPTIESAPIYHRNRAADEIQCQIVGKRTLITQRGVIDLEPGDFVRIPAGVAFSDVSHEDNRYISVLTHYETPAVAPFNKEARMMTGKEVQALRAGKLTNGKSS